MNYRKIIFGIFGLVCCGLISSCSKDVLPGDYDAAEVGKVKKVVPGAIISMRPVRLHSKNNDATNPQVENSGSEPMHRSHGFEYVIRLNNGAIISVVQADNIKLKNKQRILVIYGANTRVVPDNGSDDY